MGVLDGVSVVELAEHGFVPSCGAIMADWGADVVKVERPTGDPLRSVMGAGLVADTGDFNLYLENTYYTADLQWRNIRVRKAGVRSRGDASRSDIKLGLRVDFNRYVSGQKFLGLKSIVLKNLWQDASMMHERLAMALFARMGHPAPRESFCRLYINNEFQGLYAIVESVDSTFLTRNFGDDKGYRYSYQLQRVFEGEYLGEDLAAYKERFEAQNHEKKADVNLYLPIHDWLREVNQPVDGVWRDRVEEYVDLAQFVTEVAIEMFVGENDGLLGATGMNNFFRPGASGKT